MMSIDMRKDATSIAVSGSEYKSIHKIIMCDKDRKLKEDESISIV